MRVMKAITKSPEDGHETVYAFKEDRWFRGDVGLHETRVKIISEKDWQDLKGKLNGKGYKVSDLGKIFDEKSERPGGGRRIIYQVPGNEKTLYRSNPIDRIED